MHLSLDHFSLHILFVQFLVDLERCSLSERNLLEFLLLSRHPSRLVLLMNFVSHKRLLILLKNRWGTFYWLGEARLVLGAVYLSALSHFENRCNFILLFGPTLGSDFKWSLFTLACLLTWATREDDFDCGVNLRGFGVLRGFIRFGFVGLLRGVGL